MKRTILKFVFFFLPIILYSQEKPFSSTCVKMPYPEKSMDSAVDILHYDVNMEIFPSAQRIKAEASLLVRLVDLSVRDFYLDFVGMEVDSVFVNDSPGEIIYSGRKIFFKNEPGLDTVIVRIHYQGHPQNDGYGGFFFTQDYIYTIGEGVNTNPPSMLRYWIPSHDVPNDKASLELHVAVPENLQVISNGLLQSVDWTQQDHKKVFHWVENHPIAPYLIAIAAGDFAVDNVNYISITGDTIPVEFYSFKEHELMAHEDWKNVTHMMSVYEELFVPFPFDRYSMVELPNRGAMEHQTMTSYSRQLITGDNAYDYIVAHELAHHWFGDLVTIGDWRDLWLNEGFATYAEALYFERCQGKDVLQSYMENMTGLYLKEANDLGSFAVYDPRYFWGGTVYQKGAWIIHMLRWQLGDECFFRTLHSYLKQYSYQNVTTLDFMHTVQENFDQDLQWFFTQWIYEPGHPDLDLSWRIQSEKSKDYSLVLSIVQKQDHPVFILPVEVMITTDAGCELDTIVIDQREKEFYFHMPDRPRELVLDPNNWVLKECNIVSAPSPDHFFPGEYALGDSYPNPFRAGINGSSITIDFQIGTGKMTQRVSLVVYNVLGQVVAELVDKQNIAGAYSCFWDGTDSDGIVLPSGVYFYQLTAEGKKFTKKMLLTH